MWFSLLFSLTFFAGNLFDFNILLEGSVLEAFLIMTWHAMNMKEMHAYSITTVIMLQLLSYVILNANLTI